MRPFILAVTGIIIVPALAWAAPSFDCSKATRSVDKLICASPALSALDVDLAAAYAQASDQPGINQKALLESQRSWLRHRERKCLDSQPRPEECLKGDYRDRVALLKGAIGPNAELGGVCGTLAKNLDALYASGGPDRAPILAIANRSHGAIQIDGGGFDGGQAVEDELRDRFHASDDLISSVRGTESEGTSIRRAGQSSIYMVESTGGTMHCSSFTFFEYAETGTANEIDSPSIVSQSGGDGGSFCGNTGGWLGQIDQSPAFIVESDFDVLLNFTVIARSQNGWSAECHVETEFKPVLKISESFCSGVKCETAGPVALKIAEQFDEYGTLPKVSANSSNDNVSDRVDQFESEQTKYDELPTFGNQQKISSYSGFEPNAQVFSVDIAGVTYIGKISHATLGWRVSPDYLVGLYRVSGDEFESAAGIYIAKTRGPIAIMSVY